MLLGRDDEKARCQTQQKLFAVERDQRSLNQKSALLPSPFLPQFFPAAVDNSVLV